MLFLIRYICYWYLLMFLGHTVFFVLNVGLFVDAPINELLLSVVFSSRMDFSIIGYLMLFPFVLWLLAYTQINPKILNRIMAIYTILMSVVVMAIFTIDAALYGFWGQKFNAYAASFAKFPKEMLSFSSGAPFIKMLLLLIMSWVILRFGFKKLIISLENSSISESRIRLVLFSIVFLVLNFIGIRGGVGKATLNPSAAYFSSVQAVNHLAVNSVWYFISSLLDDLSSTSNPYVMFSDRMSEKVSKTVFKQYPKVNTALSHTPRPNILFVVLEGWSADVIAELGGESNVTPNFSKLIKDGYLFENCYANGNRTDKGLAAILSAEPSLAQTTIVNKIEKFNNLSSISGVFAHQGYSNVFVYGGDAEFANMKAYLLSINMNRIVDYRDFPLDQRKASWGVHDDVLFDKVLKELDQVKKPFFCTTLTLSSHDPFDVPHQSHYRSGSNPDLYRNAVHFSDEALGVFMRNIQSKSWYKNTLVVIVSDHGNLLPKMRNAIEPAAFHIPCLITGGALLDDFRNKKSTKFINQTDLAETLLNALKLEHQPFYWSRDAFADSTGMGAFFRYNDGTGFIDTRGVYVYDNHWKKSVIDDTLQTLHERYRKLYAIRAVQQLQYQLYLNR